MSLLDHTDALWADGRKLMEWLDARVTVSTPTAASRKRVERWRKGAQASFWDIDELLVAHGLHVSQVPCDIWKHYNNGIARRAPATVAA